MKQRVLTDEQVEEARQMRLDGVTFKAIAGSFGVSRGTVQAYLDPGLRERKRLHSAGYSAGHYQRNKEARKRWQRDYRADNPEMVKASNRRERAKHKDAYAARSKVWRSENLPYILAHNAARKALILGATIGNMADIEEVYRQAREDEPIRCYLCGGLIALGDRHVDHKVPLSKGGKHTAANLGITHSWCNLSKHDRMPGGVIRPMRIAICSGYF